MSKGQNDNLPSNLMTKNKSHPNLKSPRYESQIKNDKKTLDFITQILKTDFRGNKNSIISDLDELDKTRSKNIQIKDSNEYVHYNIRWVSFFCNLMANPQHVIFRGRKRRENCFLSPVGPILRKIQVNFAKNNNPKVPSIFFIILNFM